MVQMIENWADIDGKLVSSEWEDQVGNYCSVRVHIDKVKGVRGFANLLQDAIDSEIKVYVPLDRTKAIQVYNGRHIRWRVSLADPLTVIMQSDYAVANDSK
jgi:hypothetical protein